MKTSVIKTAAAIVVIAAAALAYTQLTDTSAPESAGRAAGEMRDHTRETSDVDQVRRQLAALRVADRGPIDGYDRDLFPHWSTVGGRCDTREMVLRRDGKDVVTDEDCQPTAGTWTSPYDGGVWDDGSDVDIDHMVPLAHAWRTGAADWTTAEREAFANDLDRPQLWAVTDNVNQSKGDGAPDEWLPPLGSYRCDYGQDWITVKYHYQLTVTDTEVATLSALLDQC